MKESFYTSEYIPDEVTFSKIQILSSNKARWWIKSAQEQVINQLTFSFSSSIVSKTQNKSTKAIEQNRPHVQRLLLPGKFFAWDLKYVDMSGVNGGVGDHSKDVTLLLGSHNSFQVRPTFLFYP